jgi:hypothetical protein
MRLRLSEALWLSRRRQGWTQAMTAQRYGVGEERYRNIEKGRLARDPVWRAHGVGSIAADLQRLRTPGTLVNHPLTPGEACALARRRCGWTLPLLAALIDRSRMYVWQCEHYHFQEFPVVGQPDPTRLLRFWMDNGWTEPAGTFHMPLGDWAKQLDRRPR